jgi:hypothetical protein
MTELNESVAALGAPSVSLGAALRAVIRHRGVHFTIALWICGIAAALLLAHGSLPFDRPAVAKLPFAALIAGPTVALIEVFVLMVTTFLVTAKRVIPDIAARAPERSVALRETLLVVAYAALGQAGGWIVGPALGFRPFSFHLAGSMFGGAMTTRPAEVWMWASYNFIVFALLPYLYFRRRYTSTQLSLRSTDRRNDILLILIVLVIEYAVELSVFDKNIFGLTLRQQLMGAPLSFVIFFIGTVLPTMVLIYSILLPRYLKLTGSTISTVLLGGLTYAAMHLVEGWSVFDSSRTTALSLIFVLFQYFGPGMIKSVLTLRTGNAWVHAIGYHAIAPHVLVDTPLVVEIFGIV